MVSRGLVAFLGGAATKQSEILDEQRKLKQEEERQRVLLRLREEAERRNAEHVDSLTRGRVSDKFSGVNGDEFIYRNNDGVETSRRALSPEEIKARDDAASKEQWERDYKERELALRGRALDVSAANSRRAAAARGGSDDGDGKTGGASLDTFTDLIMSTYSEEIKDLSAKGVPRVDIRAQARQVASAALSNAGTTGEVPSLGSIEDHFTNTLRSMYADVEERKYNNGRTSRDELKAPTTYTHIHGTSSDRTTPVRTIRNFPSRD